MIRVNPFLSSCDEGGRRTLRDGVKPVLSATMAVCLASTLCAPSAWAVERSEAGDAQGGEVQAGVDGQAEAAEGQVEAVEEQEPSAGDLADGGAVQAASLEASGASQADALSVPGTEAELSGIVTIHLSANPGMVFDIDGGRAEAGLPVQTWYDNTTIAQRFRIEAAEDGYVKIVNLSSGKVLDVEGASTASGTRVQQYDDNGTAAQRWKIVEVSDGQYAIVSKLSDDLVLDVEGGSTSAGARVQVYRYNGTAAQKFSFESVERTVEDGVYCVKSVNSGLVLDVEGASDDNGANVQQYEENGTYAQKFLLKYDEATGYYTFTNAQSAKMLEVAGAADYNSANVAQYESNGTRAQKWTIKELDDGSYAVYSAVGGRVLDVSGASTGNGGNVQVWSWDDVANQKWQFVSTDLVDSGLFEIRNAAGLNLDVEGNATSNGTPLKLYEPNGTQAQKFILREAGNFEYVVEAVNSGKVLEVSGGIGPSVVLSSNTGASSQKWELCPSGQGCLYLKNVKTGTVLGSSGLSASSGAYAAVSAAASSNVQKWKFVSTAPISEGCYEILSATDLSYVVDVDGGSSQNGAKVQLYRKNGTDAQKFWAKRQSDGTYVFVNLASGKALDVKDWYVDASTGAGVVQQWELNDSTAQRWRVEYASDGSFTIYSVLGDGQSCLDVDGNVMENGRSVGVYRQNGTSAQRWVFSAAQGDDPTASEGGQTTPEPQPDPEPPVEEGTTTYVNYNMTLDQMVAFQMDNPYVTASKEEVKNALDPDVTAVGSRYQFADLRGYSGATAEQLDAYIDSTNLGKSGMLHGMGWAFVEAAKTYDVNEVYLLAHAIIESGWGTSTLAMGYYYDGTQDIEGKYYPAGTYYNFYGIGAYDSSPLSGGRSLAIQNGWDSPEEAILGAAKWITTNYTYGGIYPQPTLYDMKWDPKRTNDTLARGWHQYATDILWARSIATVMDEIYSTTNLASSVDFIIPRYAG